ncbi:MAG: PRC-barrel domain-containing protein [Thermoleophilia bacterium]|nr:PRC-barrel domain-containing protein [Thermoleophilia bacterium]
MARNEKDFLGLEVVSLEDASVVGEVDGLIVDETTNSVVGLVLDLGIYEARALAFSDVLSVGEDAVMISSPQSVKPISQHAALLEIAERQIEVSDALAITDKGNVIGVIGDFFVDPATGNLKGVEVISDEDADEPDGPKAHLVPMDEVVRIGAELVMLRDGFEGRAVSSGDEL